MVQPSNIMSATPAFSYTVTVGVDIPFSTRNEILATGSSLNCSIVTTTYSANISILSAGLLDHQCCYNVSAFLVCTLYLVS